MTSSAPGDAGCADSAKFRALINGSLSNRDEAELARHLDECESCRAKLDAHHSSNDFSDKIGLRLSTHQEIPKSLQEKLKELDSERMVVQSEFLSDSLLGSKPPGRSQSKGSSRSYADVAPWLADPAPHDEPGTIGRVSEFQLLAFLGRGGMGVVFRARDTTLDRMVALKIMSPSLLADEDAGARFLREAKSAAAIKHPNVVTIHSIHDSAELPFLVMEFIEGESLQQRLRRLRRQNSTELADIARQVASGLAAAHTAGVVHRDVKPANILMEADRGRIVVSDFGLARATDSATLTSDGTIAGTLTFLAPERVDGLPADHRSDLFSLGSVLYTAASGEVPFDGDAVATTLHRISRVDIVPLPQLVPDAPGWLVQLVGWLHQRRPEDRPRNADEVVAFVDQHTPGGVTGGLPGMTTHIERPGIRDSGSAPSETRIEPSQANPSPSEPTQRLSEMQTMAAQTPIGWERWALMTLVAVLLSFAAAEWFGGGDSEEPPEHPSESSFVVLAPDVAPLPFGSLEDAIRHARNGEIIEIHSPEPVELPGFELDRDLEIRAAPDNPAELIFRPGPNGNEALFETSRHLTLDGLLIHVESHSENDHLTVVESHNASLRILNCRILNPNGAGVVANDARRVEIDGTEIQCPREVALTCEFAAGGHLEIHTSHLGGQVPLRLNVFANDTEAHVTNTALLGHHVVAFHSNFEIDADEPCHIRFVTNSVTLISLEQPVLLVSEQMPEGEAVAEVIEWEGQGNLWQSREIDDPSPMIGVEFGIDDPEFDIPAWSPETPEKWRELSSVTEDEPQWGTETRAEHFEEIFDRIEQNEIVPPEMMLRERPRDE